MTDPRLRRFQAALVAALRRQVQHVVGGEEHRVGDCPGQAHLKNLQHREASKDPVITQGDESLAIRDGGAQPVGHPALALAWPECRFTIRQDSLTAWNALAGMRLSKATSPSGHCGKALPWKYQLLPLSARISP